MKYYKQVISILLFFYLLDFIPCFCQTGGTHTYDFLNLTNSARVAALGGKNISLNDSDLNLPFHNPALLTPQMDKNIVFNYVSYFADINYEYVSYAFDIKNTGTFALGMHYVDYGKFIAADQTGLITGNFYAAEYALNLFYSRAIDSSFHWGVNVKTIYSNLEHYNSTGIAADAGITYSTSDKLTTVAMVMKNLGMQITSYTGMYREPLPFEIQLGVTHKLSHAPFRFSFTAQNIQRYKLTYDLPDQSNTDNTDNTTTSQSNFGKFTDNLFRHIIAGVEFLPGKTIFFALAYNYQRRQELALADSPGSVGFSFGFGIRLKRFSISYGRATYHAAGGSDHFSFLLDLSKVYHR